MLPGWMAGAEFMTEEKICKYDTYQWVIHGNEDETDPYEGLQGNYPGAVELVERWSARAGCTTTDTETPRNLLLGHGMETYVQNWMCPDHRVALWTLEGVGHVPVGKKDFTWDIVAWLLEGER